MASTAAVIVPSVISLNIANLLRGFFGKCTRSARRSPGAERGPAPNAHHPDAAGSLYDSARRRAGFAAPLQSPCRPSIVAGDEIVSLAGGRMFDPYHKWLGIAKEEQPPTYYRLLGINVGEQDPEVIEEAAIRQTTHIRTNQLGPHAEHCTRLLNEIAKARATLLDPAKRRQYDATLPAKRDLPAKKDPPRPAGKPARPWLYAAAGLGPVTVVALVWMTASLLGSRTNGKDPGIAEAGSGNAPKLAPKS